RYEDDGSWTVVRQGAVGEYELEAALGGQFHFDPETYVELMDAEVPSFGQLQDALAVASGDSARRILELGTGTGETARRLLERHPNATLLGLDASAGMLAYARRVLPAERADLRVGRIQADLPVGPFDLVASALAVHHLDDAEKAELFARVRGLLEPGGRFVLADVVV